MTTLVDIRKAKAIGKTIADLRQSQNIGLRSLADISGLTIQQIVYLESGNCYAFHQSYEIFMKLADQCLETLNLDKENIPSQPKKLASNKKGLHQTIPAYLRKAI